MRTNLLKKGGMSGRILLATLVALGLSVSASAADPDPDRYIVSFLDVGKGKAALKAAGARIELELAGQEAAAVHIPPKALNGLRNNPNIEYIEKDALRFPMAQTTPWGIPAVQADLVSDGVAGNRKICIIDSGYAASHEDLTGNNAAGKSGTSWNSDSCFHGSHVAGTIAAVQNTVGVVGVLPNKKVNLHIVKVFDGPDCAWSYSSTLVAALDECRNAGSNVVSMSLGGGVKSRTEERAFTDAYNANVLSVAAAGNDGNTRLSYPASYNSVISVAAVDSANVVADFSQQNSQVELSGPGVAVRSTVGTGAGLEESLVVGGVVFEAAAMDGSPKSATAKSGPLHDCGLGTSDCGGALNSVCLIERGTNTFADKVQNCKDGGGVAAVIYNNLGGGLFGGTLGTSPSTIPAVAVSSSDGVKLKTRLGQTANVTVATGNYAFYDGTSMATPHVSGVAALVWSQDPSCTNAEIRNALAGTAFPLGPAGRDVAYGYGLVQAKAASDAIGEGKAYDCGGSGGGGGGGGCTLAPLGASCTADAQCCSGTCKGRICR